MYALFYRQHSVLSGYSIIFWIRPLFLSETAGRFDATIASPFRYWTGNGLLPPHTRTELLSLQKRIHMSGASYAGPRQEEIVPTPIFGKRPVKQFRGRSVLLNETWGAPISLEVELNCPQQVPTPERAANVSGASNPDAAWFVPIPKHGRPCVSWFDPVARRPQSGRRRTGSFM
jgi:hypothetical protein